MQTDRPELQSWLCQFVRFQTVYKYYTNYITHLSLSHLVCELEFCGCFMSVNLSEVCKELRKGNVGDKRVAIIIDQ